MPIDSDNDGVPDYQDDDSDDDGLSDSDELTLGPDPTESDTDGDGRDDATEVSREQIRLLQKAMRVMSSDPSDSTDAADPSDPATSDASEPDNGGDNTDGGCASAQPLALWWLLALLGLRRRRFSS